MRYLVGFLVLFALANVAVGKECTNIPTELSSHTFRSELLASKNESWRAELFKDYHLIPTDDSQWSKLLPRKHLQEVEKEEFNWAMLYRKIKNSGGSKVPVGLNILKDVSLHDVRLDPGSLHGMAQQTNLEYLLILDVDRLALNFRKTAGLPAPGTPLGGWEAPDVELRGHFVGHYMSATAQMWASTHNDDLYKKMTSLVTALSECQKKMGTGYLSAFPSTEFDRLEARLPIWAPYYTIHKILAGLLDQYTLAENEEALKMAVWMVEYFNNRVQNVISTYTIERHWLTLNEESGGMNDVLYKLYSITGDPKHLVLAHLFDKPCFLGMLAMQDDSLSQFHTNTHIPIVIGAQMRYQVTGDPLYKAIGTYFLDIVNASHTYATGGTSVSERWSDPKRLATTLQTENEESCTTYNMLKVSRHLFRWTKEMAYADYYERALTNGVLSIQRGREPGIMIYMLPLGRGNSKARSYHGWGTKFDTFWCCYGTGIESFSKLGDSIYFESEGNVPVLYVIQFISSSLNWKVGQLQLNQTVEPVVSWDPYLRATFTVSANEATEKQSTLNLRIPFWTHSTDAKAAINAQHLPLPSPGNFLSVTRKWSSNDKMTLELPLILRTEAIKDERPKYYSLQAILYGPYLLAGLTDGDWDLKTGSAKSLSDWISPIPANYNSQLVSLTQESSNQTLVMAYSSTSITMNELPESGTDAAVKSTFRIVYKDANLKISSRADIIGKTVMLEPFDLPEIVVMQQGTYQILLVTRSDEGSSQLRVVPGLDGKDNTVSFESVAQRGCFVSTGADIDVGTDVQLSCKPRRKTLDDGFQKAASFTLNKGLKEYHPISFTAKGANRNFILEPLLSLRDESYTVYFNMPD